MKRVEQFNAEVKSAIGVNQLAQAITGKSGNQPIGPFERVKQGLYGIGLGVLSAAGGSRRDLVSSYKDALKTSGSQTTVLFHGGPESLKGGVINPSLVRGNASNAATSGNVAALNKLVIESASPAAQSALSRNIEFMKTQLSTPGSYASSNVAATKANIAKSTTQLQQLQEWTSRAAKENYFSAVKDPTSAYAHEGAIHVITPKPRDVVTLGPSGEYQVVGQQAVRGTFATGGSVAGSAAAQKTAKAIADAQALAEKLGKPRLNLEVLKQTLKNARQAGRR